MNRTIKFRVWDFITKKFDDQIYKAGEQFGHPSSCDWIPQQSTGLTDKNIREIYEGDILKYDNLIVQVIWESENAAFQTKSITGSAFLSQQYIDNFEIMGNIYKNPELLMTETITSTNIIQEAHKEYLESLPKHPLNGGIEI